MERKKTRLNESEMKVMQIIWNAGHPITGQQVLGQITEQYKGSLNATRRALLSYSALLVLLKDSAMIFNQNDPKRTSDYQKRKYGL